MKVKIFTDGGSRQNPGPAGIGGVIYNEHDEIIGEVSEYIGTATNNVAEYQAILVTLDRARELGATEADCYLDSLLVVKQMNREWKVKDKNLQALNVQVHNMTVQIGKVRFIHVYREQNKKADYLVNKAIDAAGF